VGLFLRIMNEARQRPAMGLANMLHYFHLTLEEWHKLTEDRKLWYSTVWNKYAGELNIEAERAKRDMKKARGGRRRYR